MYSNYEMDDDQLYQKASFRVKGRFFVSLLILALIFGAEYFIFHQSYYPIAQTELNRSLLIANIGQFFLIFFLILLLSTGKKWTRILYWLLVLFDFGLMYFPVLYFISDPEHTLSYVCIIALVLLKDLELIRLGLYIYRGQWARVFFDLVYEEPDQIPKKKKVIDEEPEEEIFAPIKASDYRKPVEQEPVYIEQEEEPIAPVSKSKISLRLGICAYGSLILFPILVQLFSKFFMSMDMKTVFAVGDIFILAMCSAVIWTIPVFFLFYDHRFANRVVVFSILLEICVLLAYTPKFVTYISSGRYAWTVFLLFIGLNIIRYGILGYAIAPIFSQTDQKA